MTLTPSLVWKRWLWEKSVFLHHSFAGLSLIQWRQAWSGRTREQVCHTEDRDAEWSAWARATQESPLS